MTDRKLMQQALDFLVGGNFAYPTKLATALRERLAQPEQDPVAYVLRTLSSKSISDEIAPTGWSTFESKMEKLRADPWVQNGIAEIVPLSFYTATQQREWQGLTENEMKNLADTHLVHQPESYEMSGVFDLIRAVAEKLEEKNT
ncbi:MAG: hypothetical protein IM323_05080 [Microcystis sp. M049S1]|uniref:hypothetical protein n=1 Tax=Microcystis sp. M049S1 TaxID=2771120 RepID=UPI002590BD98|nr:hypothetical protein [Microcystis sp. M049S1]MCA2862862.1 hypothetical protein [Microcystis sp. M049S1]